MAFHTMLALGRRHAMLAANECKASCLHESTSPDSCYVVHNNAHLSTFSLTV